MDVDFNKLVLRPFCRPWKKMGTRLHFKRQTRVLAKKRRDRQQPVIFLIGSPTHGNLGDHAISLAELNFLSDYFPTTPTIEVLGAHFRVDGRNIASLIQKEDTVIITGGGFLGNLWMREEKMVRSIITQLPKNRIIIFPQTLFFAESKDREKELSIAQKIYRSHHDLHLLIRDASSLEFVENHLYGGHFHNGTLAPDIVTYLNRSSPRRERAGIRLCLRGDKESILSENDKKTIDASMDQPSSRVANISTVLPTSIEEAQREKLLEDKLNEFKESTLVITDRLHGMLFAAITGTPCIAINNSSGKVKGVYHWIKHLDYIHYADSVHEISKHLHRLCHLEPREYDNHCLQPHFDTMAKIIANP